MSWQLRGRITGYDNISRANAAGRERTIRGTSLSTELLTRDNVLAGTSIHTTGWMENRVLAQTTFGTSAGYNERLTST